MNLVVYPISLTPADHMKLGPSHRVGPPPVLYGAHITPIKQN